jgi:hypothetical protein
MKTPEWFNTRLTAWLTALVLCGAAGLPVASAEDSASPAAAAETADEAAEAPAAEAAGEGTEQSNAAEQAGTPFRSRYRDRGVQDARIEQLRESARLRHENMERWRSARRWWNNPAAENRRQWNKARSDWYRDMAEARREAYEQRRPEHNYGYRYWRRPYR